MKDSSDKSSDEDMPLVNLMKKMKPAKKNTKTAAVTQGSAPRKRQGTKAVIINEQITIPAIFLL